ncbi:hypothetical protein LPJ66_009322 [Kickxella alabastrina]|uniref:Uncharacterized protein n=1 Tax=Kickxella alabastrina TaxID=61397 RepID=A0ACC1I7C5_9FUNG|nr:hypothetical protein LPJ66_009322 [Kickxella alabastrina]
MAMTAAAAVGPNSMSDRDSNRAIPTSTNQEEYSRTPLSLNQEQQEQRTSNSRSGEHLCLNGNNASSNMAYNRDPSFSSAQHRNSTPGFSPTTPGGASAYKNHGRSPLSAREGQFRPDPLGITGGGGVSNFANEGMVVSPRTLTNIQSPVDLTATTGGESSMADGNNSPVLASLAANATATRTKLNENLRKFMSNMRRN